MIYINVTKPTLSTGFTGFDNTVHPFDIYPNPNNGLFDLSMQDINGQNAVITIYNLIGDLIYEKNLETTEGSINGEIQLHDVANGVYFVKINANNKILTKKLVINR
jgi:hypothetical protein